LDGRRKKQKVTREDPTRRLTHPRIWTGAVEEVKSQIREGVRGGQIPRERELRIVHAADLANLKQKCKPVLGLTAEEVAIELRYPGSRQRERYEIVYGKDKINAVEDIKKIVRFVYENFLSQEDATPFDPHTGFCRQLERYSSSTINNGAGFKAAIKEYNKRLFNLQKSGTIKRYLDDLHSLPSDLVAFIMNQVYDRAVAPSVEITRKYENGTDNVYGELHAPFISEILVERAKMTSDQVFVDLGSGVGQVVLQAALEIGCESWGCEQMETLKPLADDMLKEFEARCELWGVAPGRARLICGDFLQNERIHKALKRADVVLVNNQAFTSQLNDSLVRLFLDLKPGCRVVSLKSFVHEHKSASNDLALNLLDVEELTYPSDYVSWTDKGGTYCISTRK
jgi:H3 lysine-79-specific histone-lysine N-methyltransferase